MSVLKDVKNWSSETHGLPWCLDIPPAKRVKLENMYPDLSQRKPAILQYWLDKFPYPCWERICYALYWQKEYEVLERVQENFFVGRYYDICSYYHYSGVEQNSIMVHLSMAAMQ